MNSKESRKIAIEFIKTNPFYEKEEIERLILENSKKGKFKFIFLYEITDENKLYFSKKGYFIHEFFLKGSTANFISW